MNLGELRAALLDNVFASEDDFTYATLTRYLNQSLQHVGNLLAFRRPQLMLTDWSGVLNNPGPQNEILIDLSGQTYPSCRQIIRAERIGYSGEDATLKIVDYVNAEHELTSSSKARPPVFLWQQTFGFVQPEDQMTARVVYLHGLPDMTNDLDTPGQSGGIGDADKIPPEYHGVIAAHATMLLLTAEAAPGQREWASVYADLRDAADLNVADRRRTAGKG